ncbi:CHC2 zinc finger domain-containing protein, partial [Cohnella faecalis]|uniref:CHC2 zinc finger domain-containing protein n=1 Tax=Cohnella faecalis TaxID=2315694 RepID=UPI001F3D578D
MNEGKIPQAVIDEVLRKHDIADTVGKYVHLSKNGKYLKGLCPFHSEKTPSFTVTPEKQIFHCYGCGKGGNAIKFVMEMEGETFPEAVKRMAEEAGIAVTWSDSSGASLRRDRGRSRLCSKRMPIPPSCTITCCRIRKPPSLPRIICARAVFGQADRRVRHWLRSARWDTLVQALARQQYEPAEMEREDCFPAN